VAPAAVDLVVKAPFQLGRRQKVATAGSCFAQHIARYLRQNGFHYLITEGLDRCVPEDVARTYNYGVFSARFGNLYTTRQLLQLFDRAYGTFVPAESAWTDGTLWQDPFRPFIQPGGFASEAELLADRQTHFRAVRRLFETCDHFIFTLGLTECWEVVTDSAVLPVCPGTVGAGQFDAARYRFRNFRASEVAADLSAFIQRLRSVNPGVKVILTVSPVPLIATMEDRSVVVSTCYSKAALRVAAEEVVAAHAGVAYFPSYEIITSNYSRGEFFAEDWREVREDGVTAVMQLFLRHYCGITAAGPAPDAAPTAQPAKSVSAQVADAICDEARLEG
jgi:hypothetical protein